jgi:hypothetical protein
MICHTIGLFHISKTDASSLGYNHFVPLNTLWNQYINSILEDEIKRLVHHVTVMSYVMLLLIQSIYLMYVPLARVMIVMMT